MELLCNNSRSRISSLSASFSLNVLNYNRICKRATRPQLLGTYFPKQATEQEKYTVGMGGVAEEWWPRVRSEPMLGEEEMCKEEQPCVGRSRVMMASTYWAVQKDESVPKNGEAGPGD